jgi:hypothetical protein
MNINWERPPQNRQEYIPPLHRPMTRQEIYKDRMEQSAAFRAMKAAYRAGTVVHRPVIQEVPKAPEQEVLKVSGKRRGRPPKDKVVQKVAESAKAIQRERDRIFDEMIMTVQHMGDDFNRMV